MRRIPLLLAPALLVGACSSDTSAPFEATAPTTTITAPATSAAADGPADSTAADSSVDEPAPPEPVLEPTGCDGPIAAARGQVDCMRLTLAADPEEPGDGTVTLPIIVLRATGQTVLQPIVIPGGGPGIAATNQATYWATHAHRTNHEIVVYDQRGTGGATPSLDCPDRDEEVIKALRSAEEPPNDRFSIAEATMVCRARLEPEGIDFDDYDTAANARDLDSLRIALGYDRWTILGIGYGGRLALESMRSFPDGIESVVLDSASDVTSGGLAATIDAGERAIAALTETNPTMNDSLDAARALFNAVPWSAEVDLGDGTGPQPFVLTGDDLVGLVLDALHDTSLIPALPGIVQGLANGDATSIPAMLRRAAGTLTGASDAMRMSVDCADGAGSARGEQDLAAAEDPGRMTLAAALAGPPCDEWGVEPTRPDFDEPVVSDIPTLVLAGQYDPTTRPERALAVAERLTNSSFYLFPGFGHGVTGDDLCATAIESQFLVDAVAPINATCLPLP